MRLKQNPIVKALAAIMILVPAYYFVTAKTGKDVEEKPAAGSATENKSGKDKPVVTENEAIAALSGYLSTVEEEQKAMKTALTNVVTKDDIQKLIKDSQTNNGGAVDEAALIAKVQQIVDQKTKELQRQYSSQNASGPVDPAQVGDVNNEINDLPFSDSFEVNTAPSANTSAINNDAVQWVYPVGLTPTDEKGILGNLLKPGGEENWGDSASSVAGGIQDGARSAKEALKEELKPIPYATIHSDSSIHNATALTALIGRIEREGKTHDPFRFQVILSGETLMANGHTMPGVANAIVSGVGTGDMAFSCVRGKVISITFNFEDGRIYNQKGSFEEPIAELGDQWGNPCVKGTKVDDIESYIAAQGVVAGLSSYADTIAKQQQTLTSSGNTTGLALTGSAGKLAAGSFASGGLGKTGEVLADRYENYYEAVYVPPGEKVSLLFIQSVPIDYIPTNRKVSYEEKNNVFVSLD